MKKRQGGGEGRGSKLLPRLELVSITFRQPLTNLLKKTTSEAHFGKAHDPWYVNILRQSVAQSKFPIATRWMLYSILGNFGVWGTRNLLCWKRSWSRPTKPWFFTTFSLRNFPRSKQVTFIMESSPTRLEFVVENRKSCLHVYMLYPKNAWDS